MTRVLVFSTLYPNAAQPNHGIFVENRLRHTLALGGIEVEVIAPVPFFPFTHPAFGRYATFARAPRVEQRHGVQVWHPRYFVAPKVGVNVTPRFLYQAGLSVARRLMREGRRFDVIDAHYFYPDGVAAVRLGQALQLPVVITGRGTDLTLLPNLPGPRAQIQRAAAEASALITVCEDLGTRLADLGADPGRTIVLRNGVDLELFRPNPDRQAVRDRLGLTGFTLISVGALIPRKGHGLVISALPDCPDCTLMIAGGGPQGGQLEALARQLGVAERVRFLGEVPHHQLSDYYSAADVLVLASEREGWANVLLEALACGAPVIASDVNGTSEVIQGPEAGVLLPERSPRAIVEAIAGLRREMPSRAAARRYAEQFDWFRIASANRALLTAVAKAGYGARHSPHLLEAARAALTMGANSG